MHCVICNESLSGLQKKFCSTKCKSSDTNNKHQNYTAQQERGRNRKLKLIVLFGGSCSVCGYDKNSAALHFHHTRDKSFQLDIRNLSNRSWRACLSESKKCVLLCANCHAELHHPH